MLKKTGKIISLSLALAIALVSAWTYSSATIPSSIHIAGNPANSQPGGA